MGNWRAWAVSIAILATAGVGAGFLRPYGAYLPLRSIAAAIAVLLLVSIGWRSVALLTRNFAAMAFVTFSALSLAWSVDRGETLTSVVGLLSIGCLAVAVTWFSRVWDVEAMLMWLFTGTTVASFVLAFFFPKTGTVVVNHPTEGLLAQPIGLFIWNSDLGFSAAVASVIALALSLRRARWWLLPVVLVNAAMVWYSNSAVSLIVLTTGIAFVLILQRRWIAITICGTALVVALVVGAAVGPERAWGMLLGLLGRSPDLTGRVDLWAETLRQAVARPLFGHGAGVNPDLSELTSAIHAHNGFVQIFFDRGLVGFVLLFALLTFAILGSLRDRDHLGFALIAMVCLANFANNYFTFASLGLFLVLWQSYAHIPNEFGRRVGAPRVRHRRVWVSAEIREEIDDMIRMLSRWPEPREVRLDAPRAVLDVMRAPALPADVSFVAAPYDHRVGIRRGSKVWGVFQFAIRLHSKPPTLLFSGFSMLKHRLVAAWLEIPHVAYIRGVVFDPNLSVGISDSLRDSAVSKFLPRRVFATYNADAVVTVGQVNRDFLIARGISHSRIWTPGPTWLDGLQDVRTRGDGSGAGRAFFLTVAWEAHGRMDEHYAQLTLMRRLASEWSQPAKLVIRVHPRDSYQYEQDPSFAFVELDRSLPDAFLRGLNRGDVVIAPLSTLAFEAGFLGCDIVFYADPVATKAYFQVYSRLGVQAKSVDEVLAGPLEPTTIGVRVFDEINWTEVDGLWASIVNLRALPRS
jgi:O-antigen ligase